MPATHPQHVRICGTDMTIRCYCHSKVDSSACGHRADSPTGTSSVPSHIHSCVNVSLHASSPPKDEVQTTLHQGFNKCRYCRSSMLSDEQQPAVSKTCVLDRVSTRFSKAHLTQSKAWTEGKPGLCARRLQCDKFGRARAKESERHARLRAHDSTWVMCDDST
jgi:hypothetical protein